MKPGRKGISIEEKRLFTESVLKDLIPLVEDGVTISKGLKHLKVCSSKFYSYLSTDQKLELQMVKTSKAVWGKEGVYGRT